MFGWGQSCLQFWGGDALRERQRKRSSIFETRVMIAEITNDEFNEIMDNCVTSTDNWDWNQMLS